MGLGAASERFELLLRRVFTVALLAISIELVANFYFQFNLLLPGPALLAMGLVLAAQLAIVVSTWFGHARTLWFGLHALVSLAVLATWPLQVTDASALDSDFKPWVWWALGVASISASIAWRSSLAWVFVVVNPTVWLLVSLHPTAGPGLLPDSIRDSAYLLLFPAILAVLIIVLRAWVSSVDDASAAAINSAISRARTDASERERQRIDALVHDQVLHTLLSAAAAKTPQDQLAAAELARESIFKLEQIDVDTDPMASVSASGLFRALRKAAIRLSPEVRVSLSTSDGLPVSAPSAEALTAATIQALENALQHSEAVDIALDMRATPEQIEISVSDDGKGFQLDRVPRNRIGLQTSIIQRVQAVGGEAEIVSRPGVGTTVKLRWSA